MKMQIRHFFSLDCALPLAAIRPPGGANAEAIGCSGAPPSHPQGYWSWRQIDGRKCWYAGKTMISKSLLRWPAKAPAQAKADAAPISVATVKRSGPMDEQARMLDADRLELRDRKSVEEG